VCLGQANFGGGHGVMHKEVIGRKKVAEEV
jgi:hypothetical protein